MLSFDEMKIQEHLVYDKYTGNLVGYVDLGDPIINYSSFENPDELASHVMVFYIRGLASDTRYQGYVVITNHGQVLACCMHLGRYMQPAYDRCCF